MSLAVGPRISWVTSPDRSLYWGVIVQARPGLMLAFRTWWLSVALYVSGRHYIFAIPVTGICIYWGHALKHIPGGYLYRHSWNFLWRRLEVPR